MPFLVSLLPERLRSYVSYVTVQELVKEIESSADHGWLGEFKEKYGLVSV